MERPTNYQKSSSRGRGSLFIFANWAPGGGKAQGKKEGGGVRPVRTRGVAFGSRKKFSPGVTLVLGWWAGGCVAARQGKRLVETMVAAFLGGRLCGK